MMLGEDRFVLGARAEAPAEIAPAISKAFLYRPTLNVGELLSSCSRAHAGEPPALPAISRPRLIKF